MPSIQVKNVPDDVHAVLRRRAAAAGQSLQEYVLALLRQETKTLTISEVFERVEHRTGGKLRLKTAARVVRSDRDGR